MQNENLSELNETVFAETVSSSETTMLRVSMKNFHLILGKELEKRKKNNPAYSLRAFAQFLSISPAALSQMMSGKRGISVKRLEFLIHKLALPTSEIKELLKNKVEKNKLR